MTQQVEFKTFEKYQVLGASVIIFKKGFGANGVIADEFLQNYYFIDVDPHSWYPLAKNLQLQFAVQTELGANVLFEIGKSVAEYIQLPAEIDSVEKALLSLSTAYQNFHAYQSQPLANCPQNIKDILGDYTFAQLDSNTVRMSCDTPYPCSFDRGVIIGFARRFKSVATISYEEGVSHRKDGASRSTYIIKW